MLMSVPLTVEDVNMIVSIQWEVLSASVLVDMLCNQTDYIADVRVHNYSDASEASVYHVKILFSFYLLGRLTEEIANTV